MLPVSILEVQKKIKSIIDGYESLSKDESDEYLSVLYKMMKENLVLIEQDSPLFHQVV